ncbi:MAG: GAF domain-containing protein, partial [Ignavibacteriales bacterium]|nr:GAF domain-containing protein [Ignavibacteriales bacterium]
MFRLKRIAYVLVPIVLLSVVFVYDVIRTTVQLEDGGFSLMRELAVVTSLLLLYLLISEGWRTRSRGATKEIGRLLIVMAGTTALIGLIQVLPGMRFTEGEAMALPQNSLTAFFSMIAGIAVGMGSLVTLLVTKGLIYHKRKKGTKRNFSIYIGLMLGASTLTLPAVRAEAAFVVTFLFALAIVMIVINSFRQNWIVFLSRREKFYALIYSALLFVIFIILSLLLTNRTFLNKAVLFFSAPLEQFVLLNSISGSVYFGMAFVSTLFHLPTAEVYERKRSELSSLHNLSRLVTQVFDFRDLVNTVTQMTREVCGAESSWLEMIQSENKEGPKSIEVAALNNITREQIEQITGHPGFSLRDLIFESKKVLLVDEVSIDRRTRHVKNLGLSVGSLLSVPLVSHNELIGVLHATKDIEFGFDQDDIDVLTTFA